MRLRALALWCAALVAGAAAYTIDCNPEYADCEAELRKQSIKSAFEFRPTIPTVETTTTTIPKPKTTTEEIKIIKVPAEPPQPSPRYIDLVEEELQDFANVLHNNKSYKDVADLSDVSLDDFVEEEPPQMVTTDKKKLLNPLFKHVNPPFSTFIKTDKSEKSEEVKECRENNVTYMFDQRIQRGCEESCICVTSGELECEPRCKHPYIRRGRRLDDPLCFESPVDECCSIVACSSGNQEVKTKVDTCKFGNTTHLVGSKWKIGCEQICTCEPNSVVTCVPRCNRLPQSDKCINVADPQDDCCEVQVCDVSQDVHEEPENSTTSTTSTTQAPKLKSEFADTISRTSRPLVLAEPILSVDVLKNNTVKVNLMHKNSTEDPIHLLLSRDEGKSYEDIELKSTNLIFNLDVGKDYILKTKETGTKFNFTIKKNEESVTLVNSFGCVQDGKHYRVGEEFHIGCTQLCECTGFNTKECVELVCPNHVGLELVSKGCVRWATDPPASPPNCCPRTARCLSDGTCHYRGIAIPNWTEVPVTLTGCEERCFCENGELDCQEVCSPLPPVPPQSLRCPPHHRPAPVNISDDDCCKQWSCVPNAAEDLAELDCPLYQVTSTTIGPKKPVYPTLQTTRSYNNLLNQIHRILMYPQLTTKPVVQIQMKSKENPKVTPYPIGLNYNYKYVLSTHTPQWSRNQPSSLATVKPVNKLTPSEYHLRNKPIFMTNREIWNSQNAQTSLLVPPRKIGETTTTPSNTNKRPFNANANLHAANIASQLKSFNQYKDSPKRYPIPTQKKLNYFFPSARYAKKPELTKLLFRTINTMNVSNVYRDAATATIISQKPSKSTANQNVHNNIHWPYLTDRKNLILNKNKIKEHKDNKNDIRIWDLISQMNFKPLSPYETVLLRAKPTLPPKHINNKQLDKKAKWNIQSPLDFDNIVNSMTVESEITKNLGRAADKSRKEPAGHTSSPVSTSPSDTTEPAAPPSFLPTIPPEIHYPDEEYERPVNSVEPNLQVLPPVSIPNYGEANKKLSVISMQADSPSSVKLLFGLPPVLVGLRGSVDLRYTEKDEDNVSLWQSQVFAPADEILKTPRLEFRLTGLRPSTVYKIKGKLFLHNLPVEPESEVYSVRTLDLPSILPVEEKRRKIDSRLTLVDVNDTAAHVSWRHFTEDELQFVDGIQVRYRPVGTPIYSMTELLHHSRSIAELHDLRPGTRYEASLVLVPPPRATTELHDPGNVEFTTSPYIDPYNWTVTIEARVVGSDAAELTWRGAPSPAERWVRVYRAAHACGASRREHDAFRLATRDLPPTIMLNGLEANAKCRVWLELFLTNGKVKTSNVIEINTKSDEAPEEIDNEIEASSIAGGRGSARGDYYGALVAVGVVAALGALTSLLLLLALVRRHRPRSVPITPVPSAPRESSLPPYDNPAYKLELQQETLDL